MQGQFDIYRLINMKILKIPNGKSEAVNQRRADNAVTKIKRTKQWSTFFVHNTSYKIKVYATCTPLWLIIGTLLVCFRRVGSSWHTTSTCTLSFWRLSLSIWHMTLYFYFSVVWWHWREWALLIIMR